MPRSDGRRNDELRPVRILPHYLDFAEGSVLIELGRTRVLCAVSVTDTLPAFLRGKGKGWITSEYSMLPRSTMTRNPRESTAGRIGGRTHEIQRLIGRSLRAVMDMQALGERTMTVDCDVLQADGGTRTAAITGAYVALVLAIDDMLYRGLINTSPIISEVAATSVGVLRGEALLDLNYEEDSQAEVDFNVVMTGRGEFVEIQGTAEGRPFSRETVDNLLSLAQQGISKLLLAQREVLGDKTRNLGRT
ncbi:MAG: ribonuclease PH [Dehalococcoidia bacterium]|nr:ribonuclease PH [Dehalococcoidia bacterium]